MSVCVCLSNASISRHVLLWMTYCVVSVRMCLYVCAYNHYLSPENQKPDGFSDNFLRGHVSYTTEESDSEIILSKMFSSSVVKVCCVKSVSCMCRRSVH